MYRSACVAIATTPLAPHRWIGIIAATTRSNTPMKFAVVAALT